MTDASGNSAHGAEGHALMTRLAAATIAAHEATERYVEIRRQCDLSLGEVRKVVAASKELREQLRAVVSSYVSMLRRDGVPPERVVVLVKGAVESTRGEVDPQSRHAILDEVVGWAVNAYFT